MLLGGETPPAQFFGWSFYAGEYAGAAAANKADQHDGDLDNSKEGSDPEVSWLLWALG
jgi:hypothetical protein